MLSLLYNKKSSLKFIGNILQFLCFLILLFALFHQVLSDQRCLHCLFLSFIYMITVRVKLRDRNSLEFQIYYYKHFVFYITGILLICYF